MTVAVDRLTRFGKILQILVCLPSIALAAAGTSAEVNSVYPSAHELYINLHQNPELSGQEVRTAAKIAERLRHLPRRRWLCCVACCALPGTILPSQVKSSTSAISARPLHVT